jgi:hypothetical protein
MTVKHHEFFIQSLTVEGSPFRPSDWVDRICSSYATFGADRRLKYNPYLKPEVMNGVRCLAVDTRLKDSNPDGYAELMQFASENRLKIVNEQGEAIALPA